MDDWITHKWLYIATLVLFVLVLVGTVFLLRRPEPVTLAVATTTPRPTATVAMILVDVRGAVARPGVYALAAGSRVQDVLLLAGNPLSDAETQSLNLARKLNDGEQIYVRTVAEATQSPPSAGPSRGERQPTLTKTPPARININTATVDELNALPGVGPALGQRIVDYRDANGPFKAPEDLKKVRGIGDVLYAQVKDLITLQ